MKQGVLIYDDECGRMDIRFSLNDYYEGLHCGTCFEVMIDNRWFPTRTPMGGDWYLVGIKTASIVGLRVRISL
jgi:Domain of unknown function (DUF5348)